MKRILFKYIFSEIFPAFFTSLFIAVFIVVATKMFSLVELAVSHGASVSCVLKIVFFIIPEVLLFSLPAAILISVLVAFLRFSSDNEIIALKTSGISIYKVLPPVIVIATAVSIFTFFVSTTFVPWGNRNLRKLLFQIIKVKADVGIKERVFCEPFKDITFYVNHLDIQHSIMNGVFVVDKRDAQEVNTIISKRAKIINWKKGNIVTFHFEDGTIFSVDKDFSSVRTIDFHTYDLNLDLSMQTKYSLVKKPKEMKISELLDELKKKGLKGIKYNLMMIELMERISIPVAVFIMGVIGVPIGMQIKVKNRSLGIGIGLLVFFIYYVCLAALKGICETGCINPILGMWIPNLLLLGLCIYFINIAEKDKEIHLPAFFKRLRSLRSYEDSR